MAPSPLPPARRPGAQSPAPWPCPRPRPPSPAEEIREPGRAPHACFSNRASTGSPLRPPQSAPFLRTGVTCLGRRGRDAEGGVTLCHPRRGSQDGEHRLRKARLPDPAPPELRRAACRTVNGASAGGNQSAGPSRSRRPRTRAAPGLRLPLACSSAARIPVCSAIFFQKKKKKRENLLPLKTSQGGRRFTDRLCTLSARGRHRQTDRQADVPTLQSISSTASP